MIILINRLYLEYQYISLNSVSVFKSASTPQIGIHWRHYLKSRFNIRVFSNQRPFQILRSMVDLPLINAKSSNPCQISTSQTSAHQIYVLFTTSQIGVQFSNLCPCSNSQISVQYLQFDFCLFKKLIHPK
jgi:hypothetical protein